MQPGSDPKSTSFHFSGSASFLTLKPVSARTVIKMDSHGGENCLTPCIAPIASRRFSCFCPGRVGYLVQTCAANWMLFGQPNPPLIFNIWPKQTGSPSLLSNGFSGESFQEPTFARLWITRRLSRICDLLLV